MDLPETCCLFFLSSAHGAIQTIRYMSTAFMEHGISAFSEGGRAYLIGMHGRIALRGGDTTST